MMKTERKKTVTLVVGPKTEAALLKYCARMEKEFPGQLWTMTDVLGVAFRRWVYESIEVTGVIDLPKTWVSNSE
jgi:hypothetical protein